jgi:predicted nuclease with RNAse H fold
VGADRLHIVALGPTGCVVETAVFDPHDHETVEAWFAELPAGSVIAIDGPPGPSAMPFAEDATVSAKFRRARGCEVELGRQRGIWVSFATGPEPLVGWMAEAARIHSIAEALVSPALETYPHAIFRTLLGRRPAKKTTGLGIAERVAALRLVGVDEPALAMWSHDALDAAAAAVVALDHRSGSAVAIRCERDDTAIWLPAPR